MGCILYELCSLRRPFEGESIATVLNNVLNSNPTALPDCYSESLTNLIFLMLNKDPKIRPSISEIIFDYFFSEKKKESMHKSRKSYQKEISIKIPTPTNGPVYKDFIASADNINDSIKKPANGGAFTNRSNNFFNFSESLLKQCPSSPIRPMLMGDFLKRRFGNEVFSRICRVVNNSIDPGKLLHEEPWIFSDICGEDNLSIIDVAIACGAFNFKQKPLFPSNHFIRKTTPFPLLSRNVSQ